MELCNINFLPWTAEVVEIKQIFWDSYDIKLALFFFLPSSLITVFSPDTKAACFSSAPLNVIWQQLKMQEINTNNKK